MKTATKTQTIYRSKRITGLFIAISSILGIFILLFLFLKSWWMFAFMVLLSGFVVHMFLTTFYVIEGEILLIKCGFLVNKQVSIPSIRKITETWEAISAPATTLDRLDILYDQSENILISPENKQAFVDHIKSINPAIEVQLKA